MNQIFVRFKVFSIESSFIFQLDITM